MFVQSVECKSFRFKSAVRLWVHDVGFRFRIVGFGVDLGFGI